MLFNSLNYVIFLLCTVVIYYIIPHKWRSTFLIAASFFFYMNWVPAFGLLLVYIILSAWSGAKWISRNDSKVVRKRILTFILILLLFPLMFYKYTGFLLENLLAVLKVFAPMKSLHFVLPEFLQPIGISFFTFIAMGYVIDVYRKHTKVLGLHRATAFISFFPQVSAGPIARASSLAPQFDEKHVLTYEEFSYGIAQILLGWFKKAVVADRLSFYVGYAFKDTSMTSGKSMLLGAIFFAIQLYCDFSAYSDMAIGSARLLGFKLSNNFQSPYLATTVRFF